MTLADPFWLVLAIPLAMSLWLWRLPSRLMLALRCLALTAIMLGLCGLSVRLPVRSGTVVLVADRSLSMPPGSEALQKEAAAIVHSAMRPRDKLAVVSFAERRRWNSRHRPASSSSFQPRWVSEASNLADALDSALSLIDREEPSRILVLSDGRWTGRRSGRRGGTLRRPPASTIDYRAIEPLERPATWPSSASKGPSQSWRANRS